MSQIALLSFVELLLSFVGTGIAGTLYYAHRNNIELPCSTEGGCDLVNASHWAHFDGISVSLIGLCGYIALALLSVVKLNASGPGLIRAIRVAMLVMTASATAFSWYLQYVAAVYIGAFCIYCRSSAITMSILFLVVCIDAFGEFKNRPTRGETGLPPDPSGLKSL